MAIRLLHSHSNEWCHRLQTRCDLITISMIKKKGILRNELILNSICFWMMTKSKMICFYSIRFLAAMGSTDFALFFFPFFDCVQCQNVQCNVDCKNCINRPLSLSLSLFIPSRWRLILFDSLNRNEKVFEVGSRRLTAHPLIDDGAGDLESVPWRRHIDCQFVQCPNAKM